MLLSVHPLLSSNTWQVRPGTKVNFIVGGMFWTETTGTLELTTSAIEFSAADLSKASIKVSLVVSSINTNNAKRDEHLKNEDFFEIKKYPTIVFQSVSFRKTPDNSYVVTGKLTMKAETKSVSIPFTFSQTNNKGLFQGSFKINRMDYGVGTGYKIGIGREVKISLTIPVERHN